MHTFSNDDACAFATEMIMRYMRVFALQGVTRRHRLPSCPLFASPEEKPPATPNTMIP